MIRKSAIKSAMQTQALHAFVYICILFFGMNLIKPNLDYHPFMLFSVGVTFVLFIVLNAIRNVLIELFADKEPKK
jgi:hypothetical protein